MWILMRYIFYICTRFLFDKPFLRKIIKISVSFEYSRGHAGLIQKKIKLV